MKEILLLYLFTVMAKAIKQADIERSSSDETVLSDMSLDAILKECTEIQKDAEFLNCSDDLRQVMKHHSTQRMGAEACLTAVLRCFNLEVALQLPPFAKAVQYNAHS